MYKGYDINGIIKVLFRFIVVVCLISLCSIRYLNVTQAVLTIVLASSMVLDYGIGTATSKLAAAILIRLACHQAAGGAFQLNSNHQDVT